MATQVSQQVAVAVGLEVAVAVGLVVQPPPPVY